MTNQTIDIDIDRLDEDGAGSAAHDNDIDDSALTNDYGSMADAGTAVEANIRGTHEALSVRRVFGDAYEIDGVTVIPVAKIAGGAGGGGGEGEGDGTTGGGFGTGFGLGARPVGVYEVREGQVTWKPATDATRLAKGGQVLAGIVVICTTLVLLRRTR